MGTIFFREEICNVIWFSRAKQIPAIKVHSQLKQAYSDGVK